jgi:hypothetical protein
VEILRSGSRRELYASLCICQRGADGHVRPAQKVQPPDDGLRGGIASTRSPMANHRRGTARRNHWARSPGTRQPRRVRHVNAYPSKSTEKCSTWSPIQGSASTVLHTPSPRWAGQRRFRLRTDASHPTSARLAVGARPNLLRIPCRSDADALVVVPVMMSAAWERLFPR